MDTGKAHLGSFLLLQNTFCDSAPCVNHPGCTSVWRAHSYYYARQELSLACSDCTLQHSGLGGNASFGNRQGEKGAEQSEVITRPLLECWGQSKGMERRKRKHERYHLKSRLEPQLASPPFIWLGKATLLSQDLSLLCKTSLILVLFLSQDSCEAQKHPRSCRDL